MKNPAGDGESRSYCYNFVVKLCIINTITFNY